jgi:D-2-hydroxyacid dehydrogenase (NADP+)
VRPDSTMPTPTRILLSRSAAPLVERIAALCPEAELHFEDELKERPELLGEIEIVFGGLTPEQVTAAPRLRWMQSMGAGVERLLTPEVRAHPFVLTNARGIHAETITEHMFGMLLMHCRRLAGAWDLQQQRRWEPERFRSRLDLLAGKTLGLLGLGAIGSHSARVGRGFGMRPIGLRRRPEPHPDVEQVYGPDEALEFFAECDVVMNSVPLTERTRHLMDRKAFAALKPGAIVINTGRGATIHTEALMEALRRGQMGAALLDVTDPEPLPPDHPLWVMENVYITPHYSGWRPDYVEHTGKIFLTNLRRYREGAPLMNVVDKDEGY